MMKIHSFLALASRLNVKGLSQPIEERKKSTVQTVMEPEEVGLKEEVEPYPVNFFNFRIKVLACHPICWKVMLNLPHHLNSSILLWKILPLEKS